MVTFALVKADPEVQACVIRAHESLAAIGFTEHGLRHVGLVADRARRLLQRLGHDEREAELAAIAGLLHDIGNVVNRLHHNLTGAVMAQGILRRLGMGSQETARVMAAIGNHEEADGYPVDAVSAALILADKSDVHRSRVHKREVALFDQHDRVNYAARRSALVADPDQKVVGLELEIDTETVPIMEYFEIFLSRMVMCRRAAQQLGCSFQLLINGTRLH